MIQSSEKKDNNFYDLNDFNKIVNDFNKRVNYIINSSKETETNVIKRNSKIEDYKDYFKEKISSFKNDLTEIEIKVKKINNSSSFIIQRIKHLAHLTEYNDLKNEIKNLHIDEMLNYNELKLIVEERLKQ